MNTLCSRWVSRWVFTASLLFAQSNLFGQERDAPELAKKIGDKGLCVVLGDDGTFALELAKKSELKIYLQAPEAKQVEALRKAADAAGLLGVKIFVQQGPMDRLHLADNLADAIVLRGDAEKATKRDDLMRVLRPEGKLIGPNLEATKPVPTGIDEWSHPYHGPDNNPQSLDKIAKAPYLTHFTAEPWYCPMPLVTVASGGRLFKAFGHLAVKEREWPWLNSLIAQNAYNGTILWQRPLEDGFMIHRNTLIATPEKLYLGDNKSCKVIDTATGKVLEEIVTPKDLGDEPSWKWMALVDNVLYAMVGKEEPPDPTLKGDRMARGWPWRGGALGKGYDSKTYPWGFGNTIFALDLNTKKVLWKHQDKEPLDTRSFCMAGNRLCFMSTGKFLAALDAKSGRELWKTTDEDLLKSIFDHKFAQNPNEGFSSSSFVKCNADALYYAGPTQKDLTAVSAKDGKLLWRAEGRGNSQLVLRENGLFAMSPGGSSRFDFLTGKILGTLGPRVNCTRATGSCDSIFVRGGRDGTIRYDLEGGKQQHICPMRPSCQDGVISAFGHLYWGPWMCDCNLTLVGVVSLEPAGKFDFAAKVDEAERLVRNEKYDEVADLPLNDADWPTFRANNLRSAHVAGKIGDKKESLWSFMAKSKLPTTAPVTAGGLAFVGGADGSVRAFDAKDGSMQWTVYTGGAITYPPALWKGRLYAGSGDGWIYALEAKTGRELWRFRAAPVERTIPVYGSLRSTWPVASGVLVDDGVVYAAAGIANHDGTHVYALDAISGKLRWHNNSSGSIHAQTSGGVSVNGHLLLHDKKLHLAGGNVVAVASYDIATGKCLTDANAPGSHTNFRAGSDLCVNGDRVMIAGQPLYSTKGDYRLVDQAVLQTPAGNVLAMLNLHSSSIGVSDDNPVTPMTKPRWNKRVVSRIYGVAVTSDAILVAGGHDPLKKGDKTTWSLQALSTKDGEVLWKLPLPAAPVSWGLAVGRDGRVIVSLEDGRVIAY